MFSFFTGKPKASANPEPSAAARGAGGGHQGGGAPAAAYAAQPQRDSVEQQNAKKKFEAEKKAENDLISLKALALKLKAAPESDKMGRASILRQMKKIEAQRESHLRQVETYSGLNDLATNAREVKMEAAAVHATNQVAHVSDELLEQLQNDVDDNKETVSRLQDMGNILHEGNTNPANEVTEEDADRYLSMADEPAVPAAPATKAAVPSQPYAPTSAYPSIPTAQHAKPAAAQQAVSKEEEDMVAAYA